MLFVGDGSGSGWDGACGWANVLVDRLTREYTLFSGAMNCSSINVAELMPYLHTINWFHAQQGRKRLQSRAKFFQVHIITDSKFTVDSGLAACDPTRPLPTVQQGLWAAMREFSKFGYVFHWHWQERSTSIFNQCCDLVASIARRSVLDTTAGKQPVLHRDELVGTVRALQRLARENTNTHYQPTLDAALNALQLLLFGELPYAEQLLAAMACVKLRDADGARIALDQLDPGWHDSRE